MEIGIYKINPGGSGPVVTPDLQEVTDHGNVTTNDIFTTGIDLFDAATGGYTKVLIDDSMMHIFPLAGANEAVFDFSTISDNRLWQWPDEDGIVALVSDIPPVTTVNVTSGALGVPGFTGNTITIPHGMGPLVPFYGNIIANNSPASRTALASGYYVAYTSTNMIFTLTTPVAAPINLQLSWIATRN